MTFKFLFDLLFRLVDLVLPLTRLAYFVKSYLPSFWRWLMSIGAIKRLISRNVIRKFGSITLARPLPFTMYADYPTWKGFVDRSYTGRHLPRAAAARAAKLPDRAAVAELFLRGERDGDTGHQIDCIRSTLLFAAFAQWFTDSFLRTAHAFRFDKDGNVVRDKTGAPLRVAGRVRTNTSNHEIDLCQIYGLNEEQTDVLRLKDSKDPGCLKFQKRADGEYQRFLLRSAPDDGRKALPVRAEFKTLHPDERILRSIFLRADRNRDGYKTLFATGLEHGNATIGNALLNTVFLREHNRVARLIAKANRRWDDERVFQTARNVMIVLLLKIVISDYIRHISPLGLPLEYQPGLAEEENWYRTNRISIEFNLLYRWHGLVPDAFSFMPEPDNPEAFRHNNAWLLETGVGKAVDLFSRERAGRIVIGNTPRYLGGVKLDTVTLMRNAGLASYNDYRECYGLSRAGKFEDVTDDRALSAKLEKMYRGDIDALEWYVGMFAERHGPDMIMGDLLMNMVAHDAFSQALTNPLLSRNVFKPETFSPAGWRVINETSTLNQIVQRVIRPGQTVRCSFSHADA